MSELKEIATIKYKGATWVITLHERRLSPYLVYYNGLLCHFGAMYTVASCMRLIFSDIE